MRHNEFKQRGRALLGGRGWMARFSRGTGTPYGTVRRWATGESRVPPPVAALIRALELLVEAGQPIPPDYD